MTDRYVGPGGNDGSDGLSWANRKLTLNGVEDTPVVAGDTVYVGPGVYRETLVVDVTGTSGNIITYIGDVTGENTDDVGGIVRVTGSDNDQTATRTDSVQASTGEDYRTFRGFYFDTFTQTAFDIDDVDNWIIEDCVFMHGGSTIIDVSGTSTAMTIRRCFFMSNAGILVRFTNGSTVDNAGHLVENCIMLNNRNDGINIVRVGGITVKNCFITSSSECLRVFTAISGGQTIDVNNCIFSGSSTALRGTVTGEVIENYNTFFLNSTDRNNVDTGANSQVYSPILQPPILFDGVVVPWWTPFLLSEWSSLGRIAGTSEATDDFFGIVRPTTSAKKSWGPIQLREAERETGTVQTGSAALTLADAGDHQIYVPVTATSTTFKVAARYESEYAGTLPRLIIRQPGQADSVDTMVAAADTWEDLSITLTPAAVPPYVVIILRSLNTSVTGDFDTYWDDLDVS